MPFEQDNEKRILQVQVIDLAATPDSNLNRRS
jgi:hypothetical protein